MKGKFLLNSNGDAVDVSAFRALVSNEALMSDYFGGKAFKRASLSWTRDWCEKELKKRTRQVGNLQTLHAYCVAEQRALDEQAEREAAEA
jgi:hypothetical protein